MKSKRRRYIQISIILLSAIGLLLLLALGLQYILASYRYEDAVRSSAEIPDGWEVVSKEDNITHIRLKEGSDARVWGSNIMSRNKEFCFTSTIQVPNQPTDGSPFMPDENGNIHVIIYYGFYRVNRDQYLYSLSDEPLGNNFQSIQFSVCGNNNTEKTLFRLTDYADFNNIQMKYTDIAKYEIGLSQAIMVSIPISEYQSDYMSWTFELTCDDSQNSELDKIDRNSNYLSYVQHDELLFLNHSDWDAYRKTTFHYKVLYTLIYEEVSFWIVTAVVLLGSLGIMIYTTIRRKLALLHFVPCLFGLSYLGLHYAFFYEYFYTGRWSSLGIDILTYIFSITFALWGLALFIIRIIILVIRDYRQTKSATTLPTPVSSPSIAE